MKYSNLILELISAGCFLKRSGARHDIWYSPITERIFPIPRHGSKEVPQGTEQNIRKLSGVQKNK
ncbi:MAG: type II toxin-antitoxin system HicA family toxin [Sodaliphilus sp.]|nr:type II toxin-antitoxin system HicA family toxin [Sodaliphilus sp.]